MVIKQPGCILAPLPLECMDGVGMLQCQPDIIQPLQQAVLAKGIDPETDRTLVGRNDLLCL